MKNDITQNKPILVIVALFLGALGVHNFIQEQWLSGFAKLALSFLGLFIISLIWSLFDIAKIINR